LEVFDGAGYIFLVKITKIYECPYACIQGVLF